MIGVWEPLSRTLRDSAPFRRLRDDPGSVVRLPLPAAAWVGTLLGQERSRPLLVVVPREADALEWVEVARLVTGEEGALYFPAPSLTPYQESDPSLPVRAREVLALERVVVGSGATVVTTPRALFQRLPSAESFRRRLVAVEPGEERPMEPLILRLLEAGYRRTDLVTEVGELAVRGGVLDFFPPGRDAPVRLDYFGDTVESIRTFDATSQRSAERLDGVAVPPLTLFEAGPGRRQALADRLESRSERLSNEGRERLAALRDGRTFPGWEAQLGLVEEETGALSDLLPGALVWTVAPATLREEVASYWERLVDDYRLRRERGLPAAPPNELVYPQEEVLERIDAAEVEVGELLASPDVVLDFGGSLTDSFHGQLPRFPREVETARERGERVVVVSPEEHWPALRELLAGRSVAVGPEGVELLAGELNRGFRLPAAGLVVFGEAQLVPRRTLRPARGPTRRSPFLSDLRDLKIGDYVVHQDHGIGQFVGLRTVALEDGGDGPVPATLKGAAPATPRASEVMEITYRGERTLLLPLARIDQIHKYSGIEGIAPRLDDLGGSSWNRTTSRVRSSMRKLAVDLLGLYAERQMATAPAMGPDTDLLRQFEGAFSFDETEDQLEAIAAVKEDLRRDRPMDRLLCGDVGFGKTEVAMRAAFKVVENGYQVAILAPTTILADQHLETFRQRFAEFPVRVEMISRFRSPAEVRRIRDRARAGGVDILIGTHRLLSRDIELPKLALLVVDEEQRFGVGQKEKLKALKKNLHVLAMSATPVPRTLQLSLAGVRDMSVIETPPRGRMAVETCIVPFTPEVVREAIEFERERGGQIYYVYNRVERIERVAAYLAEVVPGLRVTVGHGQMDEAELSKRMHAFTAGEHDLLLATTIIENGIHIPRVNTMLVHRADRFGLAQLYQLRGRVGRSDQLGYCYLMVPSDRVVSQKARKRLDALRDFTDLGAGFRIAARDLEIRGAGNLLGPEQSGHIAAVGIETYVKMLQDAIRELRGEAVEEAPSATLSLPVSLAIPSDYIAEASVRMEVYRRLTDPGLDRDELLAELADRFGTPPPAVYELLEVAELKRLAESLRVQSISLHRGRLVFRLRQDARLDPERLVELVSTRAEVEFSPSGVLSLTARREGVVALARRTLEELAA